MRLQTYNFNNTENQQKIDENMFIFCNCVLLTFATILQNLQRKDILNLM